MGELRLKAVMKWQSQCLQAKSIPWATGHTCFSVSYKMPTNLTTHLYLLNSPLCQMLCWDWVYYQNNLNQPQVIKHPSFPKM